LSFYLERWCGAYSSFLLGVVYVLLVLFVPYGIVGTWRARSFRIREGRGRLASLFSRDKQDEVVEPLEEGRN
jgi:branched-chain amino acid transport system permease protein